MSFHNFRIPISSNPIDLVSPELIDLTSDSEFIDPVNFNSDIPDTFNINSFEDFNYYDPTKLSTEALSYESYPLLNCINIPDIVHHYYNINDFFYHMGYIPIKYSINQFLIDYIYFLKNLCSLNYNSSLLFQSFVEFQFSQYFYELNQINYILNTQNNIFDTSFVEPISPIDPVDSTFDSSQESYFNLF